MSLNDCVIRHDPSRLVFLCGAGISYDPPANLPTVRRFVLETLRGCGARRKVIAAVEGQMGAGPVVSRFEVLIDEIRKLRDPHLIVGEVFNTNAYNKNHHFLGQMLLKGASVLTTNFDNCIENSLGGKGIARAVFDGTDLTYEPPYSSVIVKIHGSNPLGHSPKAPRPNLVISIKALAATARGFARFPAWREYLKTFLRDKILIVLGYSGSDEFDVRPLLLESEPERLLWLDYSRKYSTPVAVRKVENSNVRPFSGVLPLTYYQGQLNAQVESWAKSLSLRLKRSRGGSKGLTVGGYVKSLYAAAVRREELTNLILLHHSLYELVITREVKGKSAEIEIQKMKALYRLGRANEARELFERNEGRFKSVSDRIQGLYYYAATLYQLSDFKKAISVAKEQLALAKSKGDRVSVVHSLNNLGGLYFSVSRYGKAESCYRQSLRWQRLGASIEGEATARWGLGDIAQMRDEYDKAYEFYSEARRAYVELGNKYNLAYTDMNIGVALTGMGFYGKAERFLKDAKRAFGGNPQGLIFVLNALGKLYYLRKWYNRCAEEVAEAVEIIEKFPELPVASEIALIFACLHLKRGSVKTLESLGTLFERVVSKRQDPYTRVLRQTMRDRFRRRNLVTVERQIFGSRL